MYRLAKPFFLRVLTPLHAGSGNDLGYVDLPIQRERHTGFPKVEASGLKGAIREVFEEYVFLDGGKEQSGRYTLDLKSSKVLNLLKLFPDINEIWLKEVEKEKKAEPVTDEKDNQKIKFQQALELSFGPEDAGSSAHAGALGFTDARVLLFPVKSMKGVFAYVTCPLVLERFREDLEICRQTGGIISHFFENQEVPVLETISDAGKLAIGAKIILEEYTFEVRVDETTKKFACWLQEILDLEEVGKKLVVLSNNDYRDFVHLSTEVITRTRINDETGTVQQGALFTEEYLPQETILYALALAAPVFSKEKGIFGKKNGKPEAMRVLDFFGTGLPEIIQLGGNATLGKGIVNIRHWKEEKNG